MTSEGNPDTGPCNDFQPTDNPNNGGVVCRNCGYLRASHKGNTRKPGAVMPGRGSTILEE